MLRLLICLIFVLWETLASPYSFDVVKSEEILNESNKMVLAIDRLLDDFMSKESNSLFICHRATLQSNNYKLNPIELLDGLLQFVSDHTKMAFVINFATDEDPSLLNNLLIVDSYDSFLKIGKIFDTLSLQSNGYFVIVLTNSEENHLETVHNMLANCWELHLPNVVVLVPTRSYNRILLYTYFPYSEEHCEKVKPILRNYFENDSFKFNLSHFPDKCENFYQCPLYVAATNDPPYTFIPDDTANETTDFTGLDAMVIGEMSYRLNFKMIILPFDGQYDHIKRKVNVSIAGASPIRYKREHTIPYLYDSRVFVIPPGKPYTSFEKLFFPYRKDVWIWICTFFLAMAIWILVLKCISKEKCYFVIGLKNDAPILNLFAIILGGSMTTSQLPRRNFARTILGILLLTTLVLRNAYLGNLFNFLRTQKRMEPLYYQRNIYDSDVTIYTLRPTGLRFLSPNVQERIKGTELVLDDMRDDNLDGVYVHLKNVVDYNNYVNYRKPKILTTKDYINMYPIWMWVRKFSCLKITFDHQISALQSSGLVQHWQNSYIKTVKDTVETEPMKLRIDQFTGIIMICVVLYALSFCVFVMELVISKYQRRKM